MNVLATIGLFIIMGAALTPPQSTQEYLEHLVGQRLILRHYAGSSNPKAKEKDLSTAKGGCDQAVEVTTVSFEKAAVRLQLRNIGAPVVGNKSVGCAPDPYIFLKITDFDIAQPVDQITKAIDGVLQTPESYLAALGTPWELPHSLENEVPVDASRPGLTAAKFVLIVNPSYTAADRKAHVQGTVTVNCVIGTDGLVHDAVVAQGLSEGLNKNALDALTFFRFYPARDGNRIVAVKVPLQISYRLYR